MALATKALKTQVFALFDKGYSVRGIAKVLPEISKSTAQRYRVEWLAQQQRSSGEAA